VRKSLRSSCIRRYGWKRRTDWRCELELGKVVRASRLWRLRTDSGRYGRPSRRLCDPLSGCGLCSIRAVLWSNPSPSCMYTLISFYGLATLLENKRSMVRLHDLPPTFPSLILHLVRAFQKVPNRQTLTVRIHTGFIVQGVTTSDKASQLWNMYM
jgi:hypothetical protein